ncbi:sulfotransferase family protein, partial [Candidatus Parcubacteria bacterium]
MRNVLILGSGRSGTSMVAGTLAKAGYFMGTQFVPPRESNPKGFFEDHEINDINEAILKKVVPHR